MGIRSVFRNLITASVKTEDIYDLLLAVLPTFMAIAVREQRDSHDTSINTEKSTRNTDKFYPRFISVILALHSILFAHRDTIEESIERYLTEEAKVQENLVNVLNELEYRFVSQSVSRSGESAGLAFKRIGFQRREDDETYPKLRALRRTLPEDDPLGEDFLKDLDHIIRIRSTQSKKRRELLDNLQKAQDFFNFFLDLMPTTSGSDSSCPISFSHYPLVHVRNLTKILFDTIESNWCLCQGPGSTLHASRKTRLHLTKHQRFGTVPSGGSVLPKSKVHFQVLFSTNPSDVNWQSAEITVTDRE